MSYFVLKYLHLIGAVTLMGTGAGIAFFMLAAHRTGEAAFIARTAAVVVRADFLFTATAVVAQPVTGYLLMREVGASFGDLWISTALGLYLAAGLAWLPVVRIQMRLRDLAARAAALGEPPGDDYRRLFRLWFALGIPGFGAVAAILALMIVKPQW